MVPTVSDACQKPVEKSCQLGATHRTVSKSPLAWSLEIINIILRVIHVRNRWQKQSLPEQLSGIGKVVRFFFPETFYVNSELLINGNIQNWEAFWTSLSVLMNTTALALPSVFQNNRNTDLLREPMVSFFTTFFLQGDSVVYQLDNMWHTKIFCQQLLRNT
jgi:hypothetical protein